MLTVGSMLMGDCLSPLQVDAIEPHIKGPTTPPRLDSHYFKITNNIQTLDYAARKF